MDQNFLNHICREVKLGRLAKLEYQTCSGYIFNSWGLSFMTPKVRIFSLVFVMTLSQIIMIRTQSSHTLFPIHLIVLKSYSVGLEINCVVTSPITGARMQIWHFSTLFRPNFKVKACVKFSQIPST